MSLPVSVQSPHAQGDAIRTTWQLLTRLQQVTGGAALRILGLMMIGAVFDSMGLLMLLPILSILVAAPGAGRVAHTLDAIGIHTAHLQLAVLLAGFVLAGLLRAYVAYRRDTRSAEFQARFGAMERADLIARIAAARWSDISGLAHARVANAMTTDVDRSTSAVQLLLRIAVACVTLLTQLVVAFVVSARLTLFASVLLILGGIYVWRDRRRAIRLGTGAQDAMRAIHAVTAGFMGGLKTAMSENAQDVFLSRTGEVLQRSRSNAAQQQRAQAQARRVFNSAATLFAAALVGGGVWLGVPTGSLIAVIIVIARMAPPTLQLQQTVQSYLFQLPSFAAVRALREEIGASDNAHEQGVPASPPAALPTSTRLVLEGAVYRHTGGGGVGPLHLAVEPGETLGIAGPSGAGKSTFLDLVTGLVEPQQGSVRLGDRPLRGETARAWRSALAYQSQSTFQMNDTVRANLLLSGAQDVNDEDMWRALSLACVDEVVRALPGALDGTLGEVGATVSGGERQRIALARGLLRRPALLILDEALAAVDIATERRILDNLACAHPGMTVIIIAHRSESLATCARVLTFGNGMVLSQDIRAKSPQPA